MNEKLRVGVVGMGKMGIMHAGILNILPDVELVGVCEPVKLTNRILKKVFKKALVVKDVSEFAKLDLDALFITTPTRTHYPVVKEILESNLAKNLFVEKPLSASYSESKELCDLIRNKGGVGMVGYVARGGVMKDLGCYPIDLLLWYFGECNIDTASIESLTGPGAIDAAQFTVKGSSSAPPGKVSVSWCAEGYRMPEVEFLLAGSKGSLLANDDYVRLVVGEKTSTYYRLNLSDSAAFWLGAPEYYREDDCFIKTIGKNMGSQPSFDSAAQVESVIEEVERQAGRN
jgi:predicted dehydrogenase